MQARIKNKTTGTCGIDIVARKFNLSIDELKKKSFNFIYQDDDIYQLFFSKNSGDYFIFHKKDLIFNSNNFYEKS